MNAEWDGCEFMSDSHVGSYSKKKEDGLASC